MCCVRPHHEPIVVPGDGRVRVKCQRRAADEGVVREALHAREEVGPWVIWPPVKEEEARRKGRA